jgi:hypothetical protein
MLFKLIGPTAASGKWKQWSVMQPSEANFGDSSGAPANHEASVASQGHEQIPGIAHAAGNKHGAWPVL